MLELALQFHQRGKRMDMRTRERAQQGMLGQQDAKPFTLGLPQFKRNRAHFQIS